MNAISFYPGVQEARNSLPRTHFLIQIGKRVQAVGDPPEGIRAVDFDSVEIAETYLSAAKYYITLANGAHVVYARKEDGSDSDTLLLPGMGEA